PPHIKQLMNLPANMELYRGSGSSCDELRVMRPTAMVLRCRFHFSKAARDAVRLTASSPARLARLFGPVTAPRLAAVLHPGGVQRAANHLIAHARQIANTPAAHEHDRVFLQRVPFAGDINRDFLAVGKPHAS